MMSLNDYLKKLKCKRIRRKLIRNFTKIRIRTSDIEDYHPLLTLCKWGFEKSIRQSENFNENEWRKKKKLFPFLGDTLEKTFIKSGLTCHVQLFNVISKVSKREYSLGVVGSWCYGGRTEFKKFIRFCKNKL